MQMQATNIWNMEWENKNQNNYELQGKFNNNRT